MAEEMYIANLSFLLDYDDGQSNDEIEAELFKIAFQKKGAIHYDRSIGGSFQDLEQEPMNKVNAMALLFLMNIISSVYDLNQSKEFNPYIVVGYNDVQADFKQGQLKLNIDYRLLQDVQVKGNIETGV